ncbi:MoaD/ThiS family protein [Poritiphilus flavus]|uniref:Molybdopterin synthase sulfur carrier subunit n=1 Tax=Poritiphilus flavus TaxID=2697053 RepID=A0A6L9EER5_9FLAO|nr:MoaD/ThiS family protein [Poritiphilus flavus]NAS13217.1 molybdopterin synthase sulfur carrier subunit [Poritiphilus flavus]
MTVLLFGITKDIVGSSTLSLPVSSTSRLRTVGELKDYLSSTYPRLRNLSSLAVAVNNSYAEDSDKIDNFDEIALIPPVSGG